MGNVILTKYTECLFPQLTSGKKNCEILSEFLLNAIVKLQYVVTILSLVI